MASSCVDVLILGHSFVKRADRYLTSRQVTNFGMRSPYHNVSLLGKSGAHVMDVIQLFHSRNSSPHIVVIDVGTNDLTDVHIPTHVLATQVYNWAKHLINHYGVLHVVILEVLPRTTWGRHGASPSFNARVVRYNAMIKSLVFQHKEFPVSFWFHKGFPSSIESIIQDGVHLTDHGLCKYFRSIRRVILNVSRSIRRPV